MFLARIALALLIVIVSLVGVVATAYSFYRPPSNTSTLCGPSSTFSPVHDAPDPINEGGRTLYYRWVQANFTNLNQNFVIGNVTFLVTALTDPSLPHLDTSGQCVASTDKTSPASITVQVTFPNQDTESLTLTYRVPQQEQIFSSHSNPTAGLLWYPGKQPGLLLMVSND